MPVKIAILGAGPGGYVAALKVAQLGADVTIIEEDNVGGTCLNWGCIPSKVMITTAELLKKIKNAEAFGITVEGAVRPNMQRLMARKNKVIQDQSKGILTLLKHHNIHYLKGTGYLKEKGLAAARLPKGEEKEVTWDKLILATGTYPYSLPNLPFDGDKVLSSNHALSLQEVPESILIVGGGVIGCEFAFVYAIGDLLGPSKIMLAHVASTEGLVAAENSMGGRRSMDYNVVPGAIFTSPEVANVGLTEAQAKEQGYNVRSDSVLFRNHAGDILKSDGSVSSRLTIKN